MSCTICGEPGHYSPTCPLLQNEVCKESNVKWRGVCGRCGKHGHYSPTCPSRKTFCRAFAGICSACGEEGHYSPTCPKVQKRKEEVAEALAQAALSSQFSCGTCCKSLSSINALRYHLENDVCKEADVKPGGAGSTRREHGHDRQPVCSICGEHGHYSPTCPKASQSTAGTCSTCGGVGHYSPTCPQVQKKRKQIADSLEQAKLTSQFDCGICRTSLNSISALRYHLENDVCKDSDYLKGGRVCSSCGEHGHYSPTCPNVSESCPAFAGTCGACGKEGHYRPTCPQLQKTKQKIDVALARAQSSMRFDCDTCGRSLNSAQALRYHLEKGVCQGPDAKLEHLDCLEALESTEFGKNVRPGLKNNKPDARTPLKDFALTLGVVKSMGRGIRASKATRLHEGLARNICNEIRRRRPDFPFTSIQVNKNSTSKLHVDSSNAGPSLIHGLGEYRGGELYVDGRGLLDVWNKWVEFDGNVPHFTNVFTGRRYTLIFFVHQSYQLLRKIDKQYLQRLGFNFPKHVMTKGEYGTKESRLSNARKRVPKELRYAMGPKRQCRRTEDP